MRDWMADGAGRGGRRGFLVGPWWLALSVIVAAVPVPVSAQVSAALVRSDISRVKVGEAACDVFLYRTGQDPLGHPGPRSPLPDGFAFVKSAAWRMTDETARTGGLWFALHRVREGRDYCGLFPADDVLDYEDLLARLRSLPGIGQTNQWAANRPSRQVLIEIGDAIAMDVKYAEWTGPSDRTFPSRESLVRALFQGCRIVPWEQIAVPAAGEVAREQPEQPSASNSAPAGGPPGLARAAEAGSVPGMGSPVSATVIAPPVRAGAPGAPADRRPLGLPLDVWVRLLAVISGSTLLALGLALVLLWRRPGGAPPPVPKPLVVRDDARTLGAIEELRARVDEVSGRLGAGLGTLESALTELRSRREASPDLPAPSCDLSELLGLCRDIRSAVGDEAAARLERVEQSVREAALRGEEAARQLTRLAGEREVGEQEWRAAAVQIESLRAANARLEVAFGACRRWLIAGLQAAGYLDAALDPGGADLAEGVLDEAAGLWLRDARERPELQLYVRRLIGLRDYLGAAEVQRLPHFAAAGLDGVQERLREKSTFRALYQSVTLREALLGQWHHFVQSIFRALLLLDTYWPGATDPELRARLVHCVEAAERTLARHGIRPHRLTLPVERAWIAERASWVEETSLMGIAAPLTLDPEFRTRMMGLVAAAPIVCDVAVWGYDLADATDSARPPAGKSLLIALDPGSAWST